MVINKKLKKFYLDLFDNSELFFTNRISDLCELRDLYRNIDKSFKLSKEEVKEIKEFWKPYKKNISLKWCKYYYSKNKKFSPMYIPNTIYYSKIDQYFNNRKLAWGFNDKNYYSKIFEGISQPKTCVRKINGILLDENYKLINVDEAMSVIQNYNEIICKPSLETGSGRDIEFLNAKKEKSKIRQILLDANLKDIIIQDVINQHPLLSEIHPESVNTIRVTSILFPEGCYILSSVLRMGMNDSKVDNATSKNTSFLAGLTCGINEDGTLKKYGYTYTTGIRSDSHPNGYIFEGKKVPSYNQILELVKQSHSMIPHYRLVSWDIAVNFDGNPILIEANMRKGGINFHQFDNGPIFGELTKRVLDEVYGVNKI